MQALDPIAYAGDGSWDVTLNEGPRLSTKARKVRVAVGERDMLNLLHERYSAVYGGARRYTLAEHVGDYGTNPSRIADLIVVDTWSSGAYSFHGHEVKVSRSDWLAELRAQDKADAFRRYMDHWWPWCQSSASSSLANSRQAGGSWSARPGSAQQ